MRPALLVSSAFAALLAAAGCASIVGIPDASLEWCKQPANQHDFCDDFDHSDPFGLWSSPPPPPGTTRGLAPGDSLPYALDTEVGALDVGTSAFTGLETSFPNETFDDVKVGVDLRVAQTSFEVADGLATGAGFLLLADSATTAGQPSLCVGLGLLPEPSDETVEVALYLVPNSSDCVTVANPQTDAQTAVADASSSESSDGGTAAALPSVATPYSVGEIYLGSWTHISLELERNSDGSGVLTFAASPSTGGLPSLPSIPAGSLGPGLPQLGIATDVTGPSSGPFELLFDNVTADFGD